MENFKTHLIYTSKRFKLPYLLNSETVSKLHLGKCKFCEREDKMVKTYQNVGLVEFSKGFVKSNVFPLCKLCYTTRAGLKKNDYINACKRISGKKVKLQEIGNHISRYVVKRKCKYSKQFNCSNRRKLFTKSPSCKYCKRNTHLTVNRINSNMSYANDNVQVLCWLCNRMKGKHAEGNFLSHCRMISKIKST